MARGKTLECLHLLPKQWHRGSSCGPIWPQLHTTPMIYNHYLLAANKSPRLSGNCSDSFSPDGNPTET